MHPKQIRSFTEDGYIAIPGAFSRELAEQCVDFLWTQMPVTRDPKTWTQPVIRLGDYAAPPLVAAANTPILHRAFDALVGKDAWLPRMSLGSFPIRFPSDQSPGDDGWHVDASFPGDDPSDFFQWRINAASTGRALLMLFLFSDVTDGDAPTRLRVGSHRDIAATLAPHGDRGLSFMELAATIPATSPHPIALATGAAGTVYLVHPFMVHAAQAHHGTTPRFMAQPPLFPKGMLKRSTGVSSLLR